MSTSAVIDFRAALSSAQVNDLPDAAFAHIESGGKKDDDGKTTPRGLRHYPIHDKAHADNALSRANAQIAEGNSTAKGIAEKALPRIKAAVKKFGDAEKKAAETWNAQHREAGSYEDTRDMLSSAISEKFDDEQEKCWTYICDFGDDWVVFSKKGEKLKSSYKVDGDTVTLDDDPQPVRTVTTYQPLESKSAPTMEDSGIAYSLKNVKMSLAEVKARQLADPDNDTDPDDKTVMGHIENAEAAVDQAITAQSKDGHEDARSDTSKNFPTAKRAFSSLVEHAPDRTVEVNIRMATAEDADPNVARFLGYPSTTGVAYSVRDWLGEYTETIHAGAFGKTLREQKDVPLLFNHDGIPLASTASRTSVLTEDGKGLRNEAELDRRDATTNSIVVQLDRGVLTKMSFSFRATKETWNDTYDQRGVNETALYDTSIVTYPANSTAEGGLVEAMRSALGREGRSLWLAEDGEMSVRSALPLLLAPDGQLPTEAEDVFERALRALAHADQIVARSTGIANGMSSRRSLLVAESLVEMRAGKVLSAKSAGLIKTALDALSAADKSHAKVGLAHESAKDALGQVLDASAEAATEGSGEQSEDGKSKGTPPGNGSPINPQDGAGPRSMPPNVLAARRQVEALRRGRAA